MKEKLLKAIETSSNEELDQLLGLRAALKSQIELTDTYSDGTTGSEALYTSYRDLFSIKKDLIKRKIGSFADVGAGISRSKILFDLLEAPFTTTTYEIVPERVSAARKAYAGLQLRDSKNIRETNLLKDELPSHQAYLFYLPTGPLLYGLLEGLKRLSLKEARILYVIESHGDFIPYLEENLKALHLLDKIPLTSQRHGENLHVYELKNSEKQLNREANLTHSAQNQLKKEGGFTVQGLKTWELWHLFRTYRNDPRLQLLIEEEDFSWLGSLEKWRYGIAPGTVEILYPYRIVKLNQIKALIYPPHDQWEELIQKRRETFKPPLGELRKLIVSPEPQVEYAGGEKQKLPLAWQPERYRPLNLAD